MHSLVLCCDEPLWRPAAPAQLAGVLQEAGLAGQQKDTEGLIFAAGEHFLSLVMFLGCAPQISLTDNDAVDGQPVCRIRLHIFETVTLLESQPAPVLRCPACRSPQPRPSRPDYNLLLRCSACGEATPLFRYDWRRSAGFGRCMVEIENVFPHEAVPADRLTAVLESMSGHSWDYFYLGR